jgi:hypothetical protein
VGAIGMNYDVVVVGGGAAGLAAAVAAASRGVRTALLERYGFLGGMATAGMVSTICGLYHTSPGGPPEPLNGGLPDVFARRLAGMPGCAAPVRRGRLFVLPYTPFAFAALADQLTMAATPHLDVYLHTYLIAVESSADRVEMLRAHGWDRPLEFRPGAVVDCTGDALVATRAGVQTASAPLPERQIPSVVFVLQHVESHALEPGRRVALLRSVAAAEMAGHLPKGSSNLSLAASPQPGEVICKLALGHIATETLAGRDAMTAAEQEGRARVGALTTFLRTMPGFASAFLSHAAPQVGVREGRRLIGQYQLTRDDVLGARRFEDGVARASWPIELWDSGRLGASYEYLEDGQYYEVPLRALRSRHLRNLFAAGRCVSATREALGSARVIGTCLATGEAAGAAAARIAAERA